MGGIGADGVGHLLILLPFRDIANAVRQTGQQIKAHVFRVGQVIALRVGMQQ